MDDIASATETLRIVEQELRSRLAEAPARALDLVQQTGGRLETSDGVVPEPRPLGIASGGHRRLSVAVNFAAGCQAAPCR